VWKDVGAAFLDLVAPRRCAGCELELLGGELGWCEGCAVLLEDAGESHAPPAPAASLYAYGGPLRDAIRRLKYGRRTELLGTLGPLLAGGVAPYAGRVDVVVPVPLHPRRLRERGFDQAALLAKPVAAALCLRFDPRRLRRVRHTRAQAGLDAGARVSNVREAFVARDDARRPRVLLVDDVRTTGATFTACAEVLRRAGATHVYTLSLARAVAASSGPGP